MSTIDDNGSPGPDGEDAVARKKRKRNRAILSCTNCKARKIKCSRQIPCENCLKRGAADSCRWAEAAVQPPAQVFELSSVAESVRANLESRLAHLEVLLNVPITTTSAAVAKRALLEAVANNSHSNGDAPSPASGMLEGDEAEGAAHALEVLAGGDMTKPVLKATQPIIRGREFSLDQFTYNSVVVSEDPLSQRTYARIPTLAPPTLRVYVEAVLSYIQSYDWSIELVHGYFNSIGWVNGSMCQELFIMEHRAFWQRAAIGERTFDPTWLGLYCAALAQAVLFPIPGLTNPGRLEAEDFYELSRYGLELSDWRRKPSLRAVQTLFCLSMYNNARNDLSSGYTYLAEATRTAMAIGINKLGSDPSTMPREDISVPSGSLLARELCCRVFWDLLTQDWIGATMTHFYSISPHMFTTCGPKNFKTETLLTGSWDAKPEPLGVFTDSTIHYAKGITAEFVREMVDLGSPPAGGQELDQYYARVNDLDAKMLNSLRAMTAGKIGAFWPESVSWRQYVGLSGINTRRLRLHRPLMTRGYRDARFLLSTRTCVECAQAIMAAVRKLAELDAPTSAIWFLHRHAMTAILALYIDVLHDADTSVPNEQSDLKLADIPSMLYMFKNLEKSPYQQIVQMGRRGRLLIQALDAAKIARRQTKGSGRGDDYGLIFRRVASDVKESDTPSATFSMSSNGGGESSTATTPTWLNDESTRSILASLGLLEPQGQVNGYPQQDAASKSSSYWEMPPSLATSTSAYDFDFFSTVNFDEFVNNM